MVVVFVLSDCEEEEEKEEDEDEDEGEDEGEDEDDADDDAADDDDDDDDVDVLSSFSSGLATPSRIIDSWHVTRLARQDVMSIRPQHPESSGLEASIWETGNPATNTQ